MIASKAQVLKTLADAESLLNALAPLNTALHGIYADLQWLMEEGRVLKDSGPSSAMSWFEHADNSIGAGTNSLHRAIEKLRSEAALLA